MASEELEQLKQAFDNIAQVIQSTIDDAYEFAEECLTIVEKVAVDHNMTLDEFLDRLKIENSIESQIQEIDERKFMLDDNTAKWN